MVPIPFTQFLQQPKLDVHRIDTTVVLPREQTVVISAGQLNRAIEEESCVPVLCDIPGLAELVTPKVIAPEKPGPSVRRGRQPPTLGWSAPFFPPSNASTKIARKDMPTLLQVIHTGGRTAIRLPAGLLRWSNY